MVPTFILTRTFAISALFVGGTFLGACLSIVGDHGLCLSRVAFPVTYAAPIPNTTLPSAVRPLMFYSCQDS